MRPASPPLPRLARLDSLRGVAALAVVLYHCWLGTGALGSGGGTAMTALGAVALHGLTAVLGMGRAAVMLFFVLSGFVLAHSLRPARTTYKAFVIKRVLRIYPAFLVVIVASYWLHGTIGIPHPDPAPLMVRVNAPAPAPLELLKTLLLWGTRDAVDLDLVTWSLVHEMRVSLIFPLLWLSVCRYGGRALLGYATLSACCTLWLFASHGRVAYGFVEATFTDTLAVTGFFVVFFAAGAYLELDGRRWAARLRAWPAAARVALAAACGLVFLKGDHGADVPVTSLIDYAHGVASMGVIALLLASTRRGNLLEQRPFAWFGRISYSLYLLHLPILYVVAQTFAAGRPALTFIAVLAIAPPAADLLSRTIEFPCLAAGRKLAARFQGAGPSGTEAPRMNGGRHDT